MMKLFTATHLNFSAACVLGDGSSLETICLGVGLSRLKRISETVA